MKAVLLVVSTTSYLASGAGPAWYPYDETSWAEDVVGFNHLCQDGTEQSPIDFPTCLAPKPRPPPTITWATQTAKLTNNGHTVQLTVNASRDGGAGGMDYTLANLRKKYNLLQCHFHHGSEHSVGGKQYPLEVHCVHMMDDDVTNQRAGVFGVFYEEGSANTFLQEFEDELPTHPDSISTRRLSEISFDLLGNPMDSLTKRRMASSTESSFSGSLDFNQLYAGVDLTKYYSYSGSFTTPPCTEIVDFYIYMQPATLTQSQLTKFKTAMGWQVAGGNFRPPQNLGERTIYGCDVLPEIVEDKPWYPYKADVWAESVGAKSHAVCMGGSEQSPIDFANCALPSDRSAIGITWAEQPVDLTNNGHTVQLTAKGSSQGKMTVNGKTYTLLQCHFHWASEHTVGGKQYPFEAHCVHQLDTDDVAPHYGVFGIFYDIDGNTNSFLDLFADQLPAVARRLRSSRSDGTFDLLGNFLDSETKRKLAGDSAISDWHGPLDFKALYGDNPRTNFWNYAGSFTTPPCTEAVDFYIMMDPASLTVDQLNKFKIAIGWTGAGGNFRPPQRIGTRVVSGCDRMVTTETLVQDAVQGSMPYNMKELVAVEINAQIKSALEEEQGEHTGMLVALVVLAGLILISLVAMAGVLVLLLKKSRA